jgi:hypothetical protein
MAEEKNKPEKKEEENRDNPVSQPDPETLRKTDPQENMKGPVSSAMNKLGEKIEEVGEKDKEDSESKNKE